MPPEPTDRRSTLTAYAMLAIVMLFWAGNSIVGRAIRDDVPPLMLALMRWTGAFAIVLPFALPSIQHDRPILRREWRATLILGMLGIATFNALLYSGLAHTTATNALLLQAGVPALVLLVDRVGFGIRPRAIEIAAVMLAIAGIALVVFHADWRRVAAFALNPGDGLVLASVAVWAVYTALLRLRPPVAPATFLAVTFAIGVAAMIPAALIEGLSGRHLNPTPGALAGIAYVAIFPSTLAYAFYNRAVAVVGPAGAGRAIALLPLFGALLAALLLGEPLHFYHAIGMAMILAGIVMPLLTIGHDPANAQGGAANRSNRR